MKRIDPLYIVHARGFNASVPLPVNAPQVRLRALGESDMLQKQALLAHSSQDIKTPSSKTPVLQPSSSRRNIGFRRPDPRQQPVLQPSGNAVRFRKAVPDVNAQAGRDLLLSRQGRDVSAVIYRRYLMEEARRRQMREAMRNRIERTLEQPANTLNPQLQRAPAPANQYRLPSNSARPPLQIRRPTIMPRRTAPGLSPRLG